MKIAHVDRSHTTDLSALVGMVAGIAMLLPAIIAPELRPLSVPGFAVLVPSLLVALR